MRTIVVTIAGCMLLGMVSFGAIFYWQKQRIDHHHAHLTSFDWFCEEFGVTGEQRERIGALHTEYFPGCEDHCVHYAGTQATLAEITGDARLDMSPQHREAAERLAELEKEADKTFIDFVYRISAEMDSEESLRYRQRMKSWLDQAEGYRAPPRAGDGAE
jgi:hypothetical protein